MTDAIDRIAARLRDASRVLVISGAGMSVDSGLPTYRGVGGLYDGMVTEEGLAIEDVLSGTMMRRDPGLCWKYIMQVEEACRGARPNLGHRRIAQLEERAEVWVLTQNVDGLHRAAGSTRIIDIHGDVRRLLCRECGDQQVVATYEGLACPPRCPICDGILRPDVVLFGEMLPMDKVARLEAQLSTGFDVVLSVGTSSLFPYIAQPVRLGRRQGALTVEINPGDTVVSDVVEEKIAGAASETLDALWRAL